MNKQTTKFQAILTAALATALTTLSAEADSLVRQQEVTVSFPAGASTSDRYDILRLQARRACSSRAVYAHTHLREERQCRQEFLEAAISRLDDPALIALNLGENHEPVEGGGPALALAEDSHSD